MTNGQRATVGFAPGNPVISTGQTVGDPLVRATFGYAYTLDGVGNRTKVDLNEPMMPSYNAETINYTYTLGNILNTADGATYTHDANGNRTSKTNGTNVTMYTYDSLNRLTQTSTSTRQIQYISTGLGQRVGRIDNGVQTNYLIDPNGLLPQVLAETDNTGNLIAYYVYDGAGLVAKVTAANEYYFYHYDGLGSTIAITDSNAQVVNTYCYSPEGLVGVQETIPNPFTYVGRFGVMAEGNGLYFMRARYYDPEVGRFLNKDPIGFDGGDLNLYVYTENNPVNWTDPYGFIKVKAGYEIEFIILFTLNPYIIYKVAWIENQLPENLEIEITDSWRTFKQYKKLYPAKGWKDYIKNKHTQLRALDINAVPKASSKNKCNISKTELANLARQAGFKGIGFYNLHLHIDLRRTPATWKGESK